MWLNREINLVWMYWLLTDVLLIGALVGWSEGFAPVIALCGIQALHFLYREGRLIDFPVQVRIAYLFLLLIGQWEPLIFILWLQAIGTTVELLFGYCTLARLMTLMPWNRTRPLTLRLIQKVIFSAPVKGSVLEMVD